jgi:hypothetical protein
MIRWACSQREGGGLRLERGLRSYPTRAIVRTAHTRPTNAKCLLLSCGIISRPGRRVYPGPLLSTASDLPISFYAFLSSNVLHRARQRQRRRRRRYPLFSHSDACNECLVFGLIGERFLLQFLVFNRCILDTPLSISRRLLISSFCLTSDLLLYSYQSAAF